MSGRNVAVITSDTGIERDELIKPIEALREKGVKVIHASIGGKTTQTMVGEVNKDRTVEAAAKISALNAGETIGLNDCCEIETDFFVLRCCRRLRCHSNSRRNGQCGYSPTGS